MRRCAECQSELPAAAGFCPTCGRAAAPDDPDATQPPAVPEVGADEAHRTAARGKDGAGGEASPVGGAPVLETPTVNATAIEAGTVVNDRYRILTRLGAGNMGAVYRAEDLRLGEDVALKFIAPQCSIDRACASLLTEEVRLAHQVTHPNVCRVHDLGEYRGVQFISMEYVDGEDLRSLLRRIGRVPADKAHQIARQLCAGLHAAHERGVLHCDLKPANVMIDGDGNVRIADFGIAAAIGGEGSVQSRGTPAYMAPELFTGAPPSIATDLYSLGLVCYEIYTGEPLFTAGSMTELLELHRTRRPSVRRLVADADPRVEAFVTRLLDRDPRRRPPSAMAALAMIPGGDPLAAAFASGETPSPELIADAGGASSIGRRTALLMVACAFLGWLLVAFLGRDTKLIGRVPLPRSAAVLAQHAADHVADLFRATDRSARPAGAGWRFERNEGLARRLAAEPPRPPAAWRTVLDAPWPTMVDFLYRANPRRLEVHNVKGRVQWDDPPFEEPGMVRVRLDPRGRLTELQAIPATVGSFAPPSRSRSAEEVWDALFHAAGLDRTRFTPLEPPAAFVAHTATTAQASWRGAHPDSDARLRIDAAAFGDQPVHFAIGADTSPPRVTERYPPIRRTWRYAGLVVLLIVATAMAGLNVVRDRSDRRGAACLGITTIGLVVAFTVLSGDTGGHFTGYFELVNKGMGHGLLVAGQLVVFYLALEPHVRRVWPETMISWSRLLAGRFQDSLLWYHVLVGVVTGVAVALFTIERYAVVRIAGQPEGLPLMYTGAGLEALGGPLRAVGALVELTVDRCRDAMKFLMALIVLRLVTGSRRVAAAAAIALFTWAYNEQWSASGGLWSVLGIVGTVVTITAFTLVLIRFGVLCAMVALVVSGMLIDFRISLGLDQGGRFGSSTVLTFVVIATLSLQACRCATRLAPRRNGG